MSPPQAPAAPPSAGKNATLTGIYNVLETLREGRNLTDKEKHIHTQALVGVLKDLHDELDAAVAKAYGWADLSNGAPATDELLTRLVALNAKRAAEEKQGQVRWLRPEFQNPNAGQPTTTSGRTEDLGLETTAPAPAGPPPTGHPTAPAMEPRTRRARVLSPAAADATTD